MTDTYHYEPKKGDELRQWYDEHGDDVDEVDHEEEGDGNPENDNLQML